MAITISSDMSHWKQSKVTVIGLPVFIMVPRDSSSLKIYTTISSALPLKADQYRSDTLVTAGEEEEYAIL